MTGVELASTDEAGATADVGEAEAAVAAQAQTALAEPLCAISIFDQNRNPEILVDTMEKAYCTARPVTAPQPFTTQSKAAD